MLLGIILGFFGLYLVIFQGLNPQSLGDLKYLDGNLIALSSAILISIGTIYSKKYIKKYGSLIITGFTFTIAALSLVLITVLTGTIKQKINFVLHNSLNLLGFGTIASIIPFLLFNLGIKNVGPSKAASYKLLIPIIASFLSWLIIKEQLTSYTLIGIIITITGLYLVNKLPNKLSKTIINN